MNTGAPDVGLDEARVRVLEIQTKLHRRANDDNCRRFDDLYNLVADPAFLRVAWNRVRGNTGARSAGVDGQTARAIEARGVDAFLAALRADLKARRFRPLPVRERKIPKPGGKWRPLGIPTVRDRVVQASLKLVMEPILEADFLPCSYGFRPNRRAADALAEIHMFASRGYAEVFEGDIEGCFDNIDHTALLERLRRRIGDRRVLGLVKSFLKAGLLSEEHTSRETHTGTPQGGILSPLLANLALSVLDEHFGQLWQETSATAWRRASRASRGLPTYRLVRYADDFVVLVRGTHEHAEQLREMVATVLATVGLRLAPEKTRAVHVSEGFDFLGHRIKRDRQRGSGRYRIYTYPSKAAVAAITRKVKTICRRDINRPLTALLRELEPVLRGWAYYYRHGSSSDTFGYLGHYTWRRVVAFLRRKYKRSMQWIHDRFAPQGWWPEEAGTRLFHPASVHIVRYRYRGAAIPSPWVVSRQAVAVAADGRTCGEPDAG